MLKNPSKLLLITSIIFAIINCGGGGGGDSGRSDGASGADFGCDGSCANLSLTTADTRQILAQGVSAASSLNVSATFAVVDRVGNVLAVYQMAGAAATTQINGENGAAGGLEGAVVRSTLAAISKAGTGAFLSSQGNAFSTRTASQIIQENFNPGERNQPGGPLFGVQFSQLPCSDVTHGAGPKPLPLGLSGDPGGMPLYKSGDLVGGIGVELDGVYRIDRNISDTDNDPEERIAMTASLNGFEAPSQRVAPNINLGKSLRYADIDYSELSLPATVPAIDDSRIVSVPVFFSGTIRDGTVFGTGPSGFANTVRAGQPAADLAGRYGTRGGSPQGGAELKGNEVDAILDSAITTAFRLRAAIRRPLDSGARVSIWVVDTQGTPLGFTRAQDAPVFGTDVALQKARTAAFFSSADAGQKLSAIGFGGYVNGVNSFVGQNVLNGSVAFAARSVGNLARPFYTDGINGNPNGPFSLPFPGSGSGSTWSPFNDGLQLDLDLAALLAPLSGSIPGSCVGGLGQRLANGIQIFAGGVPLYRGNTLIGAIGISGDGIDQDDTVAFYSVSRRGLDYIGHTEVGDAVLGFNAPMEIRADNLSPAAVTGTRLRYVNCPEAPFVGDNSQSVCDGA